MGDGSSFCSGVMKTLFGLILDGGDRWGVRDCGGPPGWSRP